jgi:hypothetical protein
MHKKVENFDKKCITLSKETLLLRNKKVKGYNIVVLVVKCPIKHLHYSKKKLSKDLYTYRQ